MIVYYSDVRHPRAYIDQSDVAPFGDLLQDKEKCDLDLLLQSSGGDIDKAEKIVYMCRNRSKSLRVIVAESAKSAATLIALGADEIVMGDASELGPIDPQLALPNPMGPPVFRPAQSILDGVSKIVEEAQENPLSSSKSLYR
ncbi:MAG: hypothetical protein C4521_11060 [Actinobacteria bacterium]|nr:MAG: hypothetical protein C4521_11060 [Actinomycetota bacterium]